MNVRELLGRPAPRSIPKAPRTTLSTVAERINGHRSDAKVLGEALSLIATARTEWSAYIDALQSHRVGADEETRIGLRDRIEAATDQLSDLAEGEVILADDHRRAIATQREKAKMAEREALAVDLDRFASEFFSPFISKATELLARCERLNEPSRTVNLTPPLAFAMGFMSDRRGAFLAGIEDLKRRAPAPPPAPVVVARPAPKPQRETQGPVGPRPSPIKDAKLVATREPDDREPLQPDEVRVRVLRDGFSPADDRPQAYARQILRMPRNVAERSAAAGLVKIIEHYADAPPPATPDDVQESRP